jgi:hypothetical protein
MTTAAAFGCDPPAAPARAGTASPARAGTATAARAGTATAAPPGAPQPSDAGAAPDPAPRIRRSPASHGLAGPGSCDRPPRASAALWRAALRVLRRAPRSAPWPAAPGPTAPFSTPPLSTSCAPARGAPSRPASPVPAPVLAPSRRAPRALLRDRSGASAVEFAILAPLALLIVTSVFEGFALHAAGVALEAGAAAAARRGALSTEPGPNRQAAIRTILMRHVCPPEGGVCHLAPTPLPPGDDGVASALQLTFRAHVDPRNIGRPEPFADLNDNGVWDADEPFTDLNGNGRWDADMGVAGLGGSGDFVSFTVRMAQPVRHPALRAAFGPTLVHETRFTVRNEPY